MQISVEITEEVRKEAIDRGVPVVDFVETLIARGLDVVLDRTPMFSAIQRIRALRASEAPAKR